MYFKTDFDSRPRSLSAWLGQQAISHIINLGIINTKSELKKKLDIDLPVKLLQADVIEILITSLMWDFLKVLTIKNRYRME